MFRKILIANRGEIACRIMQDRPSDWASRRSPCIPRPTPTRAMCALADEAVRIGPAPAREVYLDAGRILEAARAVGAEAIHPGYGFLSENADFAEACARAGIVFIGPPPAAIRAMG